MAQYTVTGGADPYSAAAQELMRTARSRAEASFSGSAVYTNGASVQTVDIHDVISSDLARIALFVLGGILLVLIVLVRALVAPLYLLLSVVLSLGATIGATSIVFQGFGGQSGLVFWVPFLILTMLIGLATDYNILIVSRVREELRGNPDTRAAVAHAVSQTGGIIVTCGLVLAGSFGTLMLASVTGLRELGFAVAFGVIFDTVLLRTMLIPALIVVVGDWSWFPGRLASAARPAPAALPGNAGIRAPFGQSATRSEPGR